MTKLTRFLKLRIDDNLTADARYNLQQIDNLGGVFPSSPTGDQTINASGDIRLRPQSSLLGGDNDGTVFAPSLELSTSLKLRSGQFRLTLNSGTLSTDLSFTLPSDLGESGQALTTDGAGTLSWQDPPTTNLSTLDDTSIVNPEAGQVLEYNGTNWVNSSIGVTRQGGTFTWTNVEGVNKTITHNFNTTNILVQIYDNIAKSFVSTTVDFLNANTIVLTSEVAPPNDYKVLLLTV